MEAAKAAQYAVRGCCNRREWVIDGPHGCILGEFPNEPSAREAARKWAEIVNGEIEVTWSDDHVFDADSDRGDYCIRIRGTRYEWHAGRHWHAMEECIDKSQSLHDLAVKHGMDALKAMAAAL